LVSAAHGGPQGKVQQLPPNSPEQLPASSPRIGVSATPRIGVLAIQGDFAAHAAALCDAGAEALLVRKPEQLRDLDGLILPGGESTTFLKILDRDGFL
jgi:hypothetical protein